jgi:hypothetical protein
VTDREHYERIDPDKIAERVHMKDCSGKSKMIHRLRDFAALGEMPEETWKEIQRVYLAQCSYIDDMFGMIIDALKDAGIRVPEEVSVVGYDGIDAAGLPLIGLTTVAQPRQEMAEAIMDILLRHAEEPSLAPEHFLAKPELMLRSSTRAR